MGPLGLVVIAAQGGGVGEDRAGDDPLREVVLVGGRLGEVDRHHRVAQEHHGGHPLFLEGADDHPGLLGQFGDDQLVGEPGGRGVAPLLAPAVGLLAHALEDRRILLEVHLAEDPGAGLHRRVTGELRRPAHEPLDQVVAQVHQVLLGGLEVAPHVWGVLAEHRVGHRQAAADAQDATAGQLLGVGPLLAGAAHRGERADLLGHLHGVGAGCGLTGTRALHAHDLQAATPHLVAVLEHRVELANRLGPDLGRVRVGLEAGRQVVVGGLVGHDRDGVGRDALTGVETGRPRSGHQARRRVVGGHRDATGLGIAFGAPVVVVDRAGLHRLGVGDRHG